MKDYNYYLTQARKMTKNKEEAEDILQTALYKVMALSTQPTLWDTYFYSCLKNEFLMQRQARERRITRFNTKTSVSEYLLVTHSDKSKEAYNQKLYKAIEVLSEGQKKIIKHCLSGQKLITYPGNYNTTKAQYRNALVKLRKEMIDNE